MCHRFGLRVFVVAALALAGGHSLSAGTGWRLDYEFAGHGDDWYGENRVPQLSRDYPADRITQLTSGDDFGFGFDPFFNVFKNGPLLYRTRPGGGEYLFRFSSSYGSQAPCWGNAGCLDPVFCNGPEQCLLGACAAGVAPSCDDGIVCSRDRCDAALGECVSDHLVRAEEANGLTLQPLAPHSAIALLSWNSESTADYYNIYYDNSGDIRGLTCRADHLTETRFEDTRNPRPLLVYLVTAFGCGGESSLGIDSFGSERLNGLPCP